MQLNERVFHVISNTHWDREWRFPFQRNRQMLVDMIDSVLEILENNPEYRAFHLDSQSIVLKDYLEIKQGKAEIIKKFVEQKRLFIGPWYILPDEFLVGGENLIRNLLFGHKICSQYGGVSKVGYSPFSWGQISQLPQIYKGFGIVLIMFYRGVNSLDSYNAEFIWEGADGTKALASRFSTMPRYNFYFLIYRPVLYNQTPYDMEYKWDDNSVPFHFADEEFYHEDYFIISPKDTYYKENIETSVNDIINRQVNDFTTPNVIWMEGHDSSGPNAKTVQIIRDIKEKFPNLNVVHSTLEDYSNAVKKSANIEKLPLVKGERRSAQNDLRCGNLYGYVTSARTYLKLQNFKAEKLLQFYAEPFYTYSGLLGNDIYNRYTEIAWKYLVQNSAHDSIGGCSLDEIHDDMMNRYKQSMEISTGVFERACKYILKNVNLKDKNSNIFVAIINPLHYYRNEITKLIIDIPEDYDKGDFDIIYNGEIINKEILLVTKVEPVLEQLVNRPMYFKMVRYEILAELNDIKPNGYKIFEIIPKEKLEEESKIESLQERKLSNKYLDIEINENGTINIFDKVNNNNFNDLLYFIDEGEEGHAWVNKPKGITLNTLNERPSISIIKTKLQQKAIISYNFKTFRDLDDRLLSGMPLIELPILVEINLNNNEKFLRVKITVDNKSKQHRLRVILPTDINSKYHYAETNFDVVERSAERPDTSNWIEQPMYDFPFNNFVDVVENNRALAVFSNGLKEYEYKNDNRNSLAFTLIRAFNYVISPASTENYSYQNGSQELGVRTYKFGIYPHSKIYYEDDVVENAYRFNYELKAVQLGKNKSGELSDSTSFFELSNNNILVSCFKLKETKEANNYILRIYNPTPLLQKTDIMFFKKFKKVIKTNLEEIEEKILVDNSDTKFSAELGPKKILTFSIIF
ncbi:MAG TPA: glycoside hydrolase family 38 C-terminal domain-containing protein [Ignavibacteriales bacterium]|nr:glycoside hydrolase family 38 C-terminal domain-containing protein [Ignavibacteriales bacterium]